jgi:hypothetical protein
MTRTSIVLLAAFAALLIAIPAHAQHAGDIYLGVEDDAIVTGHINQDLTITTPVYVFGGVFGDTGVPHKTANPGFNALPGTFDPGSYIGFDILDALLYWNGDGFEPVPHGETLTVGFITFSATTGAGFVPGFDLSVPGDGEWHVHYEYALNAGGGDDPTPGIYLLTMHMRGDGLDPTEPFWLVLRENDTEANHAAALAWAEQHLAPSACPGDLDDDGAVGLGDLNALLSNWGSCPDPGACPWDIAPDGGDGVVGLGDLNTMLSNWGPCP